MLWKEARTTQDDEEGAEDDRGRRRVFARAFSAFNLAQVEGYAPEPAERLPESTRFAHAEAFVAALDIPTTEGAYHAPYRIDLDHIFMPPFAAFDDAKAHLATLAHEAAHASGAAHRLDRNLKERFQRDTVAA